MNTTDLGWSRKVKFSFLVVPLVAGTIEALTLVWALLNGAWGIGQFVLPIVLVVVLVGGWLIAVNKRELWLPVIAVVGMSLLGTGVPMGVFYFFQELGMPIVTVLAVWLVTFLVWKWTEPDEEKTE